MIVIRIELWPKGFKEKARELGTVVIANDGTGTNDSGNYDCALSNAGFFVNKPGSWKGGKVTGYRRSLSPYHLLQMALNACLRGTRTKKSDELIDHMRRGGTLPRVMGLLTAQKEIERF